MKAFLCWLLFCVLLAGCSKNDAPPSTSPPAATSALAPQLIVATPPAQPTNNSDDAKTVRGIAVKNAGDLYLTFPKNWADKITRVPEAGKLFDSILFRPRTNEDFELMVNVNNVGEANANPLDLRDVLQKAGKGELETSVETTLDIHDFQGTNITGCYFVVTDKKQFMARPEKGQYLYLTQGYAKIDGLVLSFRLVSNKLVPAQDETLEMIKTARLIKK